MELSLSGNQADLTLSTEAELLAKVRQYALERGTTVDELVKAHLFGLVRREAQRRLQISMDSSVLEAGCVAWTREELHERKPG